MFSLSERADIKVAEKNRKTIRYKGEYLRILWLWSAALSAEDGSSTLYSGNIPNSAITGADYKPPR